MGDPLAGKTAAAVSNTAADNAAAHDEANDTRKIVVSMPDHLISVYEGNTVVRSISDFSTGRSGHLTPLIDRGKLDPSRRDANHVSSAYRDRHGKPAPMPFSLFIEDSGGIAFHQGDTHADSHGCIHLDNDNAKWLFKWAGKREVDVQIIGPDPHHPKATHQNRKITRPQGSATTPAAINQHHLMSHHGPKHGLNASGRDQNTPLPRQKH